AGPLRGRTGQRRGLDLDAVLREQRVAGGAVDLGAQPDRGGRALAAQVQVAVAQTRLLPRLAVPVALEGQRCGGAELLDLARAHLAVAAGQQRVLVALGAAPDGPDDLQHVLVAQVHRLVLADHHLGHAARVAQIEERHAAVVTATADPAGEGDGLSDVLLAELTGGMGAQHEVSFWWGRQVMARPGAGALDGRHARAWMAHLTARGERSRHCGPVARAMAPVDSSTVRPA